MPWKFAVVFSTLSGSRPRLSLRGRQACVGVVWAARDDLTGGDIPFIAVVAGLLAKIPSAKWPPSSSTPRSGLFVGRPCFRWRWVFTDHRLNSANELFKNSSHQAFHPSNILLLKLDRILNVYAVLIMIKRYDYEVVATNVVLSNNFNLQMKAHPIYATGEKAKDPLFGHAMDGSSQTRTDLFRFLIWSPRPPRPFTTPPRINPSFNPTPSTTTLHDLYTFKNSLENDGNHVWTTRATTGITWGPTVQRRESRGDQRTTTGITWIPTVRRRESRCEEDYQWIM
ncbi:hypothetical protein SSX86_003671 [Deinandra increscens subsp. villosa]|uniref:Uncharacterized protein n=1 Tax=Deinandra increscens subsp. villosa TaxID=3103831 RepID=A0AAP0DLR5_9ASTR